MLYIPTPLLGSPGSLRRFIATSDEDEDEEGTYFTFFNILLDNIAELKNADPKVSQPSITLTSLTNIELAAEVEGAKLAFLQSECRDAEQSLLLLQNQCDQCDANKVIGLKQVSRLKSETKSLKLEIQKLHQHKKDLLHETGALTSKKIELNKTMAQMRLILKTFGKTK